MEVTQKPGMRFFDGIPIYVPNEVLRSAPEFYVSYCARTSDYGCSTTALVVRENGDDKFYLLCGDHRKGYAAASTLEACFAYFMAHADLQHEFSAVMAGDSVETRGAEFSWPEGVEYPDNGTYPVRNGRVFGEGGKEIATIETVTVGQFGRWEVMFTDTQGQHWQGYCYCTDYRPRLRCRKV